MVLRHISKIFRTPLLWLCVLIFASSCEIKFSSEVTNSGEENKSVSQLSQEVCECLNENKKGDIDARMTPCINKITIPQTSTLAEGYSQQDSAATVDAMMSKETSKVPEVTFNLVTSCDAFGSEIEALYDKWYPVDSSAGNLRAIKLLSDKFQRATVADTSRKRVLHELIARNIKAKHLGEGIKRCQQIKSLYKNEGGAYFASAFIYNLQKKYPLAISELNQEVQVSKDSNLRLVIEVMKRKSRRDNIPIN
ncbi:MAG: hypothetical protein EOO61_18355 [Hymenobacter sp.]|nr:MAG: hypothetical protein EOO61_18355 [Hymenobacter sp.]